MEYHSDFNPEPLNALRKTEKLLFFLGGGATLYADLRMAQFHSAMSETSKIAGEAVLTGYLGTYSKSKTALTGNIVTLE